MPMYQWPIYRVSRNYPSFKLVVKYNCASCVDIPRCSKAWRAVVCGASASRALLQLSLTNSNPRKFTTTQLQSRQNDIMASRPPVHQDYISRIRYTNALPPPPCPPKLLDIPNTGLSSGQYTSAGFASRLAREQPPNIEADAELGMPIDLVGIPKVFDGDESGMRNHHVVHVSQ